MTYLEAHENYTEVAEEGKTVGFYFQLSNKQWMAFSTIYDKPVFLNYWWSEATSEARIIGFFRDNYQQAKK